MIPAVRSPVNRAHDGADLLVRGALQVETCSLFMM